MRVDVSKMTSERLLGRERPRESALVTLNICGWISFSGYFFFPRLKLLILPYVNVKDRRGN